MNEQIRELAEQANSRQAYFFDLNYKELDVFLEKFAELIVRECVRYLNEEYERDFATSWREDLSKGMKEHFGVEE